MRQTRSLICGDCQKFQKESWDFQSSNRCKCLRDGRKRWIGNDAAECFGFIERSQSRLMAVA
jgi:hypothetical protein